jgi:LysM repeat protein
MGRFKDKALDDYIAKREREEAAKRAAEQKKREELEKQLADLKPKQQSNDPFAGFAAFNASNNAMMDKVGGAKKYYKLPKSEQKKIQKEWQVTQQKEEKAKQAKITQLQKQLDALPKPSESSRRGGGINPSDEFGFGRIDFAEISKRKSYEKEYFEKASKDTQQMVNNVINHDPNKFSVKTIKDKKGNIVEHRIVNKEKQAEMQARLANAKTPKQKEAIKKKYGELVNYTIKDPLYGYTSVHGSNPQWSNGNERTQLAPVILDRMLQGKPGLVNGSGDDTLKSVGRGATANHGDNGFFSGTPLGGLAKGLGGALSSVSKASSKILSGVAKPVSTAIKTVGKGTEQIISSAARGDVKGLAKAGLNVVEGAKDVVQQTGSAGLTTALAPTGAIAGAVGIKPLEQITENIEREGQKGIDKYGDVAIDIGANIATGGTYGAAKGITAGLAEGGLGSLVSPEMITKYGVDAAASYYGVDPTMLQAGLAATKGDLKAAALQGMGSYAGFSPEQLNMATSLAEGDITEAGALAAGLDPNLIKDVTSGKFQNALTSGLTTGASMMGGQLASEAGIDVDTIKEAEKIAKSALSGDLKAKALQQLSGAAGLSPEQTSILQAATSGNLKDELTNQAGQAAGLTNEQIQVGRTIASGDTKGLTNMASEYVIKKGDNFNAIAKKLGVDPRELAKANPQLKDINKISAGAKLILPQKVQAAVTGATTTADKFMKDAQGRTMYGANNAPILNPDYDEVLADARQLQKIKFDPTPVVGETVQQYADRMGLDPNVILEQNKGKGLSLGKAIPSNVEIALPEGFKPPTGEEKGFFDRMGDKVSGAWESITGGDKKAPDKGKEDKGFFDRATDFISDNKSGIIGGIAQGGSALLGYKAGQEAREDVEKLTNQQLADLQRQGKEFMEVSYDPERYKQERAFLQERIAKGGLTKEEEALQKQGDIRAARAAAAARLAGVEQQARLGGAAMGTSALASSLAGSQALLGEQSQTNLAREQAAAKNLESAIQRRGSLSTQETQERAELARQQGTFGLDRTTRIGGVRGDLGNLAFDEAAAKQRLYGTGADLITRGANTLFPSQEQPTQNLQTRAGAAQTIVNKPPSDKRQPPASTSTPPTQFNSRNLTAGVKPAEALKDPKAAGTQIVSNAQEIAKQKAKQEAERLKKEAEKKAKEALSPYIPEGIKNVLPSITKKEDDEEGFFGIKF